MHAQFKLLFSVSWTWCHFILYYCKKPQFICFFADGMIIDKHVQDICRKAYVEIQRISSIRHLLSIDATKTLLSAFVQPKLDYCNSPFHGSPMYLLE